MNKETSIIIGLGGILLVAEISGLKFLVDHNIEQAINDSFVAIQSVAKGLTKTELYKQQKNQKQLYQRFSKV